MQICRGFKALYLDINGRDGIIHGYPRGEGVIHGYRGVEGIVHGYPGGLEQDTRISRGVLWLKTSISSTRGGENGLFLKELILSVCSMNLDFRCPRTPSPSSLSTFRTFSTPQLKVAKKG